MGTGATVHEKGVYTCMNGPVFSTRAEAEMHRQLGFDLIGMTNAKSLIPALIAAIPESPDWLEHRGLDTAILTPREQWPEERITELAPLLGRFRD